ncbi:MAG TPA: hypothetical protein VMW68_00795 [Methyloceanibacter sp.]|nr:hypothetical protein [Methyloceanibacter sp.]
MKQKPLSNADRQRAFRARLATRDKAHKDAFEAGEADRLYLAETPKVAPDGTIVAHNHIKPAVKLGTRGFRAWLARPCDDYVRCDCKWAPHLPEHYRVAKAGD